MSTYRVLSPLSHDMTYYAEGSLIDGSLLSEGQAEALVAVGVLALVDEPETAEPAPALASDAGTGTAEDAEPVSAPEVPLDAPTESVEAPETATPEEQSAPAEEPVAAPEAPETPEPEEA